MLYALIDILAFVLTIFFIVVTHEYAHFLAARLLRVKVLCFSIGFGKALCRFRDRRGTDYILGPIPLGGYVKMLDETEGSVAAVDLPFAYNRQPFYKKFIIVLAGPLMNILLAWFLYWIIFTVGFTTIKPVIGEVTPHSIASAAELKPNQVIVSIDHMPVSGWSGIFLRILAHIGNQDQLLIATEDFKTHYQENHVLNLTHWDVAGLNPDPLTGLGLKPFFPKVPPNAKIIWPESYQKKVKFGYFAAIARSFRELVDFTYFNGLLFGKLFSGKMSLQALGGPLTIFQTAGTALNYGLLPFLAFLAFLNISIGIINLFPIPGLDGGHLLIQSIEAIRGRPLPEKFLTWMYKLGFSFLAFVLLVAVYNDIMRYLV